MADQATITRIGGILKNVYSDAIVEQQNLAPVTRKLFTKPKGVRMGGDHYEISVRVGGNRAGVGARNSDDLLPTPSRQSEKKFLCYDRSVFGVIRVLDKDMKNSASNQQAFISTLDDEITGVVHDVMKTMNIDTFMDGSGILATVQTSTSTSTTFVGAAGTAFGQFGTRYLVPGDAIAVWDPTLTTQRGTNVNIIGVDPTTRTVTIDSTLTLTANDIVVRANTQNKTYIGLQLASDNSSSVTFQGLSRSTYPILRGNVISAGGAGLSETHLQQLISLIENASGETPDQFIMGSAQWDAYTALGQSLKRYTGDAGKMDRGFTELEYNGVPFTKDTDCPPAAVHAFKAEYVQNGVVTPLTWMDDDGSTLKWDAGYAAYKAIVREYGNYIYPRPNTMGRIEALAVPNVYVK